MCGINILMASNEPLILVIIVIIIIITIYLFNYFYFERYSIVITIM